MKVSAPLLSPILRSDTQGRLLAHLYLNPSQESTATELARIADTSVPSASREVGRLVDAGYLTARSSGRNRYVRVDQSHPLYEPLSHILMYGYGPLTVLPNLLRDVTGVDEAYIFGSWAARLTGEPGPDPQDIDVLVVGSRIDMDALDTAAERARKELGREVNARAVTTKAWGNRADVFLRHLHERPLVPLRLGARS